MVVATWLGHYPVAGINDQLVYDRVCRDVWCMAASSGCDIARNAHDSLVCVVAEVCLKFALLPSPFRFQVWSLVRARRHARKLKTRPDQDIAERVQGRATYAKPRNAQRWKKRPTHQQDTGEPANTCEAELHKMDSGKCEHVTPHLEHCMCFIVM